NGVRGTFRFIHGHEDDPLEGVRRLIIDEANGGAEVMVTSSWNGPLSHTPGFLARYRLIRFLGFLTDFYGEVVVSVPAVGGMVEDQWFWLEKLKNDDVAGHPIEMPGDIMRDTGIPGLQIFTHCFGPDLIEVMARMFSLRDQHAWIEGILPSDQESGTTRDERE